MPETWPSSFDVVLPELDLGALPVRACVWLVPVGAEVVAGDRLLEVVAGEVSVELPAPVSGRLVEQCVAEDDLLEGGQLLALIAVDDGLC